MIPAIHSMRLAVRPSRIALMIGMPPATAASKATITPLACAAAKISLPCFASSALLAVTTCLPCPMAAITSSRARVSPPISSTTMSMPGSATTAIGSATSRIPSSPTVRVFAISLAVAIGDLDFAAGPARDLLAVAAQHLDGAAADRAQAQQADVHRFHVSLFEKWKAPTTRPSRK